METALWHPTVEERDKHSSEYIKKKSKTLVSVEDSHLSMASDMTL